MTYSLEQIEWLHDNGYMTDCAYYQQNGKTAQENYIIQTQKFRNQLLERRKQEQLEKDIEKQVEEQVNEAVERAIDDLFKDLNFNITLK